jgi:hypothetical protein
LELLLDRFLSFSSRYLLCNFFQILKSLIFIFSVLNFVNNSQASKTLKIISIIVLILFDFWYYVQLDGIAGLPNRESIYPVISLSVLGVFLLNVSFFSLLFLKIDYFTYRMEFYRK